MKAKTFLIQVFWQGKECKPVFIFLREIHGGIVSFSSLVSLLKAGIVKVLVLPYYVVTAVMYRGPIEKLIGKSVHTGGQMQYRDCVKQN